MLENELAIAAPTTGGPPECSARQQRMEYI